MMVAWAGRLTEGCSQTRPSTCTPAGIFSSKAPIGVASNPAPICLIQSHGAAGICDDFGLPAAYAWARLLRIADGPDEVHRNQIAKLELADYV